MNRIFLDVNPVLLPSIAYHTTSNLSKFFKPKSFALGVNVWKVLVIHKVLVKILYGVCISSVLFKILNNKFMK